MLRAEWHEVRARSVPPCLGRALGSDGAPNLARCAPRVILEHVRPDATEPEFGPFRPIRLGSLTALVSERLADSPALVLVDGRSGAGKSTFAAAAARARRAVVVATDDIAWHLHPTDWATEMLDGVVRPWMAGRPVRYAPPGWVRQARPGKIEVPAGVDLVIEGVGAARHEVAPLAQLTVWVRSDPVVAKRRGIERDIRLGRTRAEAEQFWDEWMAAERPFLEAEQPWRVADLVIDGTADRGTDVAPIVLLTDGPRRAHS
jgi:hypothetical protein